MSAAVVTADEFSLLAGAVSLLGRHVRVCESWWLGCFPAWGRYAGCLGTVIALYDGAVSAVDEAMRSHRDMAWCVYVRLANGAAIVLPADGYFGAFELLPVDVRTEG